MKHPEYDRSKYKVWALPHPLILHWVINPGLVFNELILGQRIPRVSLIERNSDKPLIERTYVPCPHCGVMHDGRIWGKGNAFGHWFGYVCPTCSKTIPCLWNVFSLIVLVVTAPIWFLPAKLLRPKWLDYEKQRLARRKDQPLIKAKEINWLLRGTFMFGGIMWIALSVVPQVAKVQSGTDINWNAIGIQLLGWLFAGFMWGAVMQFWMNKRGKKSKEVVDSTATRITSPAE